MKSPVFFFGRNTFFKKAISSIALLSLALGMCMPIIGSGKVLAQEAPLVEEPAAESTPPALPEEPADEPTLLEDLLAPVVDSVESFVTEPEGLQQVQIDSVMTVTASTDDSPITLPVSQALLKSEAHNHFSTEWSFVSGPVTPTIATPGTAYTDVLGLTTAGTYTFKITAYNFGESESVEATVDVVVEAAAPTEEQTASVDLCKVDEAEAPLSGWTLMLKGENIQDDLLVPTNSSAGVDSNPLLSGVSYIANVVGTWLNQGGANPADAEYSTIDGWDTHMDGYTGLQDDVLELQIDETSGDWGTYVASHAYARSFTPALDGSINFRIFDGTGTTQDETWFGDNLGSLLVDISKGYSGITGENGCVSFDDVPYGEYMVDEIMQDNWENVSGLGEVVVDEAEETFTVVNKPKEASTEDSVIHATKIVCDSEADLPNWGLETNEPVITATTAADFLAAHPNCHLQKGWKFEWAPEATANPGDNIIGTAGGAWTESGVTANDGTVTFTVPSGDDSLIWVREQMQPGYIPFTGSAADASNVSAEFHCNTDSLHYDNYEWIAPRAPGETYYCVAFNVPQKATLSVTKIVCPTEADLPNQGLETGPLVTSTTAADFLAAHPTCSLQPDWSFEWAPNGTPNPGDNIIGAAGGDWTLLGVTDGTGTFTAEVPVGDTLVWVREKLKEGYIPFTGTAPDASNVSAEFTCHTDGLHYDNYEWIGALEDGKTYHCVAYNVPQQQPPVDVCPNLPEVQTEVPRGYVLDQQGQCVEDDDDEDSEETIVVKAADLETETNPIIAATNNSKKWFFYNDENDTINNTLGSFVTGPESAPAGTGSAEMSVTGSQRRNIATYQFKDIRLADIDTLQFSTYAQLAGDGASGLAERAPYLNFNVDFNDSDTWQRRLVYVPAVNGVVTSDEWQTWDAVNSGNALWTWSGFDANGGQWLDGNTNRYRTWASILAAWPNIQTRSTNSWFGFRVGEPYADGFTGNVDKFVIGIDTGSGTDTTTFDFEPTPETASFDTTVVTEGAMEGWEFNRDRLAWTSGTGELIDGPDTAPLGDGSARLATETGDERIKLRKYLPIGTQISDIKTLKYSTYRTEPTGGALTVALQFDVDFDATPTDPTRADARIVYEPYHTQQALILDDTWQEWNALNDAAGTGTGAWWIAGAASSCPQGNPCTWVELNAAYPDMQVSAKSLENTIDTQGAVLFKAGGAWPGFDGNVDKFILGIKTGSNTHTETYDFEPTPDQSLVITDTSNNRSNSSGGSFKKIITALNPLPIPQVLGASTESCDEYIKSYIELGAENDSGDVSRLQTFLNEHLGLSILVDGIYGLQSFNAVKVFQKKYIAEVLDPWVAIGRPGVEDGTGYVYKTTKRWINMLKCPELNLPTPELP